MGKRNNQIKLLDVYKSLRKVWIRNPRTKIKESDKVYNRKKEKLKFIKELKDG
jgi:hypothetical protein